MNVSFEVQRGDATAGAYLAFHIFNGVFQAVREFLGTREPEEVAFATKRDELAGVYQTYPGARKLRCRKLGYKLEREQRVDP